MIAPLQQLHALLDGIVPGLFNATLAVLLWAALWFVRKFEPLLFAKLPPAFQAWPALASGAVLSALSASTGPDLKTSIVNALGGALTGLVSGVMAVGVHRTLKESKLSYGTNDIPPKPVA